MAKNNFKEVCLPFLLVNCTNEYIDTLLGHSNMMLKITYHLIIPNLMELYMNINPESK
jgi:hypothetical protein